MTNFGYCNHCQKMVALRREEKDNKVYLVKDCKDCGINKTLISSDARVYNRKRYLMSNPLQNGKEKKSCKINCSVCNAHKGPTMVFMDITNRCNMNCPICINNTPSMGFTFDPPLDYFKKIFDHFGRLDPRPAIKLFGGEPTLRKDLIQIIKLAHLAKLRVAVITNGIKLADFDYCKKLLDSGVSIRLSFDGSNPKLYSDLRNSPQSLDQKLQAIDNIAQCNKGKITLMTMVAKGYNEDELPMFLDFCHSRSETLGNICFMPLAHTWEQGALSLTPERITIEDIESMVEKSVPGGNIEFLPAGILNHFPFLTKYLFEDLPSFGGAHSNCESITFLVSNGNQYVSISNYLKRSLYETVEKMKEQEARLANWHPRFEKSNLAWLLNKFGLKEFASKSMINFSIAALTLRNANYRKILNESSSVRTLFKVLAFSGKLLKGMHPFQVFAQYSKVSNIIQVMVLPFEDKTNMESERLQYCPTHFAYIDPDTDKVRTSPLCSWSLFKNDIMRKIALKYSLDETEKTGTLEKKVAIA